MLRCFIMSGKIVNSTQRTMPNCEIPARSYQYFLCIFLVNGIKSAICSKSITVDRIFFNLDIHSAQLYWLKMYNRKTLYVITVGLDIWIMIFLFKAYSLLFNLQKIVRQMLCDREPLVTCNLFCRIKSYLSSIGTGMPCAST